MFAKLASAAAVVLATSSLVSAQTFTACNPTEKTCPEDPALGGSVSVDFTKGENDFFTVAEGTTLTYDPTLGAVFTIENQNQAPTITSTKYIFFGRVDLTVRASSGVGVVTSMVLQSDDLDEIDWEWLGGDAYHVQTNYFSKGDTTTYDRGGMSNVSDPINNFHTYSIDWSTEKIDWIIDGAVVRTLTYADAKGGATFPQTPMQLKLGTWVAGAQGAPEGTVEWAGGYTDFSDAPFKGYYQSVKVTDYSNGVTGATEYSYGDETGTYESIKITTGDGSSTSGSSSSSSASASASASSSAKTSAKTSSAASSSSSQAASSTFSTVTSSATGSANSTTTVASASASNTASAAQTSSTGSSTSSSASAPSTTANAGVKSGLNVVLLGAAFFAAFLTL